MDYATDKKTFHNDIYKNMTLREELEHRFEQYEDEKKMNELYDKYIKPIEKKKIMKNVIILPKIMMLYNKLKMLHFIKIAL